MLETALPTVEREKGRWGQGGGGRIYRAERQQQGMRLGYKRTRVTVAGKVADWWCVLGVSESGPTADDNTKSV